jgi:hypothetical protein
MCLSDMTERACSCCQAVLDLLLLDDLQQPFSLLVGVNGSVSVGFATPQDLLHNPKFLLPLSIPNEIGGRKR